MKITPEQAIKILDCLHHHRIGLLDWSGSNSPEYEKLNETYHKILEQINKYEIES